MSSAGTAYVDVEAKLDGFAADVDAAVAGLSAEVAVEADVSGAQAEIDSLEGAPLDVPVDASVDAAQAEIDSLEGEPVETTVTADTGQAEASIDSLSSSVESAVGSLADLGGGSGGGAAGLAAGALSGFSSAALEAAGASAGLATGVGALAIGIGMSVDAAMEAQVVQAQTAAMLETTGAGAYLSADAIGSLSEEIMGYSGFSDEAVASGQNMLLMFENVSSEAAVNAGVFEETTRLGADLATVMGTDVTSSIRNLGRAIDDPTAGMGRLRRAGIQLTEAQQQQIIAMQESGNLLGAQQALLDAVSGKVDGLAAAYGDTLAGQMDIAQEKFDNLKETMGEAFLPSIQDGVIPLMELADAFIAAADSAGLFTGIISSARSSLDSSGVEGWVAQLVAGSPLLQAFADDAEDSGKAIGSITDPAQAAADAVDELNDSVQEYLDGIYSVPRAQREVRESFAELEETLASGGSADEVAVDFEAIVAATADMGVATGEMGVSVGMALDRLRGMRDAGMISAQQFDSVRSALLGLPDAAIKSTSEIKKMDEAIKKIPSEVAPRFTMPGADKSEREAKALDEAIKKIPDSHKTDTSAPGAVKATGEAKVLTAAITGIPPSKSTTITANTADAYSKVSSIKNMVDNIDKDVVINVKVIGDPIPREHGGPVMRTAAYLVGERGPELFVPPTNGEIIPAGKTSRMLRDTGGATAPTSNVYNVHVTASGNTRELARVIREELLTLERQGL